MTVSKKVDVETGEVTEEHGSFAEAMVAAQMEYGGVVPAEALGRIGKGGERTYKYADLASVLRTVLPALNRHGLALHQRVKFDEGILILETSIVWTDGNHVSSVVPLPPPDNWQTWGSAMTYARRYCLMALLGVAAEEDDDDGAEASKPKLATKPADPGANSPAVVEAKAKAEATERAKEKAHARKVEARNEVIKLLANYPEDDRAVTMTQAAMLAEPDGKWPMLGKILDREKLTGPQFEVIATKLKVLVADAPMKQTPLGEPPDDTTTIYEKEEPDDGGEPNAEVEA